MIEADWIEAHVKGTNKEVFHTSNLNDWQVIKRGGTEVTNKKDGGLPEFDEMIDSSLYDGIPYHVDNMAAEVSKTETQLKESANKETMLLILTPGKWSCQLILQFTMSPILQPLTLPFQKKEMRCLMPQKKPKPLTPTPNLKTLDLNNWWQ